MALGDGLGLSDFCSGVGRYRAKGLDLVFDRVRRLGSGFGCRHCIARGNAG